MAGGTDLRLQSETASWAKLDLGVDERSFFAPAENTRSNMASSTGIIFMNSAV